MYPCQATVLTRSGFESQDFLTQPFTSNRNQPQQTATKTSPRVSDDSSILTASTSETSEARQQSNKNFEQLRTATEESTSPGENVIQVPSTKNEDWKAYGRVEGRVLLWENGTLKEKKALSDGIRREQWYVYGTLWFTKVSSPFIHSVTRFVADPERSCEQ